MPTLNSLCTRPYEVQIDLVYTSTASNCDESSFSQSLFRVQLSQ
jgi:hypothetical protein